MFGLCRKYVPLVVWVANALFPYSRMKIKTIQHIITYPPIFSLSHNKYKNIELLDKIGEMGYMRHTKWTYKLSIIQRYIALPHCRVMRWKFQFDWNLTDTWCLLFIMVILQDILRMLSNLNKGVWGPYFSSSNCR